MLDVSDTTCEDCLPVRSVLLYTIVQYGWINQTLRCTLKPRPLTTGLMGAGGFELTKATKLLRVPIIREPLLFFFRFQSRA